jgi:glycosyltransferase involved in cell wall biosynthesis
MNLRTFFPESGFYALSQITYNRHMQKQLSVSSTNRIYKPTESGIPTSKEVRLVNNRKKVLIIHRALHQYRKDFIDLLRKKLDTYGVDLTFVYGKYPDSAKKDEVDLEWGTYLPSKYVRFRGMELIWQPALPLLDQHDLVIVEQANRNIINYYLMARRFFRSRRSSSGNSNGRAKKMPKLAFWGHGRNLQANEKDIRNRFKKFFLHQCDWWFAYTEKVRQELIQSDYPAGHITNVQNAIDTTSLTTYYEATPPETADQLKQELGIQSSHIGIYCGGIYYEKRIPFLIEACDKIREQVPDFHFLVIGSGDDAHLITEAAKTRPWIHFVGPKFGADRVKYFKISSLLLMPGLVGLAILDSFALRTPMVTTEFPYHSPEIEYLKNGINGVITPDTLNDYVAAVVHLLQNEPERQKLLEGCRKSSTKYTVDQMVNNFAEGVVKALNEN